LVDEVSDKKATGGGKKKLNTLSYKFRMNTGSNNLEEFNTMITRAWLPVNKKVIVPTDEEVELNPRSRSAKLRVAEKQNCDKKVLSF
jgi:16S rRNA C1402 N4-methylase RsmH